MASKNGRKIGLAVTILIVIAGFGYLTYGGIGNNLVYFLTPAELLAKGDSVYDKPVRLGGMVVPGTVKWDPDKLDLQFQLKDSKATTMVHASKAPPQMFRENQGVIVEGKLNRAGVFEATSLMVKHSNEYKAPATGEKPPEEMYKSLVKPQS